MTETQTARYTSWLWPDRAIGIEESRQLREEHNALVNSHAELLAACQRVLRANARARSESERETSGDDELIASGVWSDAADMLRAAIAKARPA